VQRDSGSVDAGNEGDIGDSTGNSTGSSTGNSTGGAQVLEADALSHSPQELSRAEEEPTNTHETGNTLDQGLQHEVSSKTYASGHVVEGIHNPLYTSANTPSSDINFTMTIDKTTTINGADEVMEENMQSTNQTDHTTTAVESNPQVSAMTSTKNKTPSTSRNNSVKTRKTTTTNVSSIPIKDISTQTFRVQV
jgi:hypothetical protein